MVTYTSLPGKSEDASPTYFYSESSAGAVRKTLAAPYVTLTGTQTLTNKTLTDSTTFFQDESDNTKKLQLQLSGITTGTTRTLTVPDASGTIALTSDIVSSPFRKISAQTVSSAVAAVTFTSIPATGYDHFVLVAQNVVTARAATDDQLQIHVSTDNGSTFKTTSGDYYAAAVAQTNLGVFDVVGNTSTFKYGFAKIILSGLGDSTKATHFLREGGFNAISTTNIARFTSLSGNVRAAAEADNAFRINSTTSSNITAGTFTLYGVLS